MANLKQQKHIEYQNTKQGMKKILFPDISAHLIFWTVAGLGLFLDLWTKKAIFAKLSRHEQIDIIPGYLRFITRLNDGAAFSLAAGNRVFLIGVSSVAVVVIITFFLFSGRQARWMTVSLGLFLSGVCGNLWDRVMNHGLVRDFIDAYIGQYHWPTFNVADSLLCIAVGLMFLGTILHRHPDEEKQTHTFDTDPRAEKQS